MKSKSANVLIAGILEERIAVAFHEADRSTLHEVLAKMRRAISHRGPDAEGYRILGDIAIGHTALLLAASHGVTEPISNEDGTIWLVSDARIYNHSERRKSLEARGHRHGTGSDSESIIHLYEDYCEDCLRHLHGMYAFALWDHTARKLFLARDPLGVKPLYFVELAGGIVFASEIKALLASGLFQPELNRASLPEFIVSGYHCGGDTPFSGVRKLMPGRCMSFSRGKTTISRHWDVVYPGEEERRPDEYYCDGLASTLRNVVRTLVPEDGTFGALVSGGWTPV